MEAVPFVREHSYASQAAAEAQQVVGMRSPSNALTQSSFVTAQAAEAQQRHFMLLRAARGGKHRPGLRNGTSTGASTPMHPPSTAGSSTSVISRVSTVGKPAAAKSPLSELDEFEARLAQQEKQQQQEREKRAEPQVRFFSAGQEDEEQEAQEEQGYTMDGEVLVLPAPADRPWEGPSRWVPASDALRKNCLRLFLAASTEAPRLFVDVPEDPSGSKLVRFAAIPIQPQPQPPQQDDKAVEQKEVCLPRLSVLTAHTSRPPAPLSPGLSQSAAAPAAEAVDLPHPQPRAGAQGARGQGSGGARGRTCATGVRTGAAGRYRATRQQDTVQAGIRDSRPARLLPGELQSFTGPSTRS